MIPLYDSDLNENVRYLRNHSTRAERIVWSFLKKKQMFGYGFYRQKPIVDYIADSFCYKLRLIIEIDGITDEDSNVQRKDKEKEAYFSSLGLTVLRFTDEEVHGNGNLVEKGLKIL